MYLTHIDTTTHARTPREWVRTHLCIRGNSELMLDTKHNGVHD